MSDETYKKYIQEKISEAIKLPLKMIVSTCSVTDPKHIQIIKESLAMVYSISRLDTYQENLLDMIKE